MGSEAAIGVFDSGVGGISVLHEMRATMPHETFVYVADSGHCPYGDKTVQYVQARSLAIAQWLVAQGCKTIVVACNTATAAAAATLRAALAVPVIAMEPAIKPAAAATRSGVVGVLATVGTARSERLLSLIERWGGDIRVLTQPCPGLVERVEQGDLHGPATAALLRDYVTPLIDAGADTLVLGCTHYPFLRPLLQRIVGDEVALIDTGAAVARRVRDVLLANDALRVDAMGEERFWTSGDVALAQHVIGEYLWRRPVVIGALPV
jgi:glutamate racemase